MHFSDYERDALATAVYPMRGQNVIYPTLGLVGEAGEIANKLKKIIRSGQILTPENIQPLLHEIGDVLWYTVALANELGYTLEDAARMNIEKLQSRLKRGTIDGNGDDR